MLKYRNNKIYCEAAAVTAEKLSVCYTLKNDDLRSFKRSACSPYGDRKALFGKESASVGVDLSVSEKEGGLRFCLSCKEDIFSEFGVNIPFDFMGKKGGDWKKQYLFNSPYRSEDNRHIYIYLTTPCGKNLVVVFESGADGWKMDYSPYVGGHYFYNLKLLASFPKEYKTGCNYKELVFGIYEAESFQDALERISRIKSLPVVLPRLNAAAIGKKISLRIFGDCDEIEFCGKTYPVEKNKAEVVIEREGIWSAIPSAKGNKGLECTLFGYKDYRTLYKSYLDGILRDGLLDPFGNLCEGQCWLSAMLRYMTKYGYVSEYAAFAERALNRIMRFDERDAVERYSVLTVPHEGLPAYNVYKSQRVQEQFFGAGIFLDAFNALGDKRYLEFAVNMINSALSFYQREDGRIETFTEWLGKYEDYSTVCCPMINIVDVALALKKSDPEKSKAFLKSAKRLADYLLRRGLVFPTEGGSSEEAEAEMEDGSISCTALALLYYSAYVERNEKYIEKAREILALHDAWVVKTPLCCMQGSSLRWWETNWEGDKDGPALCMGHVWTIWRAEADYLMYGLEGEEKYLLQALRGFNTNLAKIHPDGRSYSIFQIDYITGKRFVEDSKISYELAKEFPARYDNGLTGYVWSRAFDTILS